MELPQQTLAKEDELRVGINQARPKMMFGNKVYLTDEILGLIKEAFMDTSHKTLHVPTAHEMKHYCAKPLRIIPTLHG